MNKETNQDLISKEEDKIVYDKAEFNKIQEECNEKTKSIIIKAKKLSGLKCK